MNELEQNIINSFRLAKSDIIKLQTELIELQERVAKLETRRVRTKVVKKPAAHKTVHRKKIIAAKEGKKFHIADCPFAQNIKPKSRVHFKSATGALNEGYKPCSCIKK